MIIVKIKGGLGNQLFQYASSKSLALKLSKKLYLDLSFFEEDKYSGIFRLNRYKIIQNIAREEDIDKLKNESVNSLYVRILKKLKMPGKYNKRTHWSEPRLNSWHLKKNKIDYPIYLEGWLGNPNYFEEIRELLLEELQPVKLSSGTLDWKNIIQASNSVSIHIRRGDYLTNDYFHSLPLSYYFNAIKYFEGKLCEPKFFFFSDDIEYVKVSFSFIKNSCYIDVNNEKQGNYNTIKDVEDLYLMSLCKNQIIANSTFSWWGAWLNKNKNKIIIAPKIWYSDYAAQKNYETGCLIPENWLKM